MLANYLRTLRMFNRNVRLYLLATGLLGFAIDGGVFTVIFNLYLLRLGFGTEYIGQVNSAALLVFALSALPAGALGSWLGIRRMLVVGLLLIVGGTAGLPAAELLPTAWAGLGILAGFVAVYAGMALYFVNAVPFVMAITTPEERAHAFSMQSALLALAAFSGALSGGFLPRLYAAIWAIDLQQPGPYRFPLIFVALVMTPGVWALLRIPSQDASGPARPVFDSPALPAARWKIEGPLLLTLGLLSVVRFFQVAGVATTSTFF
jgi:MFS family permease